MTTYLAGFSLSLSLIFAIGAQNAFILKQAVTKKYVFTICIICALSDAILIALGVAGFASVVAAFPEIERLARYGGALFLFIYGGMNVKSALLSNHVLNSANAITRSKKQVVLTCLAFTWLNPHVYLDTVVLLGSISTQYQPDEITFALGAMSASFVFFFSLGYAARYLAPLFSNPIAWKIFEFLIGSYMVVIAITLVF